MLNHYVKVTTFQGTKTPPYEVGLRLNYWKLIGHAGKVIRKREIAPLAFSKIQSQMLVQFGDEVDGYFLSCCSEEKNAFWIPHTDLEPVSAQSSA